MFNGNRPPHWCDLCHGFTGPDSPCYQGGDDVSDTAIEIGEEKLCADMEYLADFISNCSGGEREPSWFGPISTHRLIADILLNPRATDEQLAQAAKELRKRYLDEHAEYIREAAERAMR